MKTIKLKSKLSEEEALKKVKSITDTLREKGFLAKGDELIAGIDEEGDFVMVTINGDIMDKARYAELKKSFTDIGEVVVNDLKNFDDEPEVKSETPSTESEKESKEEAVNQNAVKPALNYHDTSELLITEKHITKMDDLKTLLFSEEELKESKETPEVVDPKPAEEVHHDGAEKPEEEKPEVENPENGDQKPEEKTFDEEKEVHFRVKCAKTGKTLKEGSVKVDAKCSAPETQVKVLQKLGGLDPDTTIEFFDDAAEMITFDDLYFSKEEIEASPKVEEKPEEVEEKVEVSAKEFDDMKSELESAKTENEELKKKLEEKPAEEKKFDKAELPKVVGMTPEEAAKVLAEYRLKANQGKTLSVAEKYFCESMTKYFTEEELKAADEAAAKAESERKPEEEKVEVSKKEFDEMKSELEDKKARVEELEKKILPEKAETKVEMIKRMNAENGARSLLDLAKEKKHEIK